MRYLIPILLLSTAIQAKPNVKMIYGLTGFGVSTVGTFIVPYNANVGVSIFASGFPFVGVAIMIKNRKHG